MSNSATIFNVPEPQGLDRVELETTAADAQINAPTAPIAREVEANAEHAKDAAHNAAATARSKGAPLTPTALDQFQQQASKTLDAAVAQGQHDVDAAKSTIGSEYVDQAKALATSAVKTAQSYLPQTAESVGGQTKSTNGTSGSGVVSSLQSGATAAVETTREYLNGAQETTKPYIEATKESVIGRQTKSTNGTSGPGVVSSLQSGATAAVETTKEYLNAAQETMKPHIETTKEYLTAAQRTVQPHVDSAKGAAQGYLGTAGVPGNSPVPSKDIPATSAPLESGPHSVNTPYPSTMAATNIGQIKP